MVTNASILIRLWREGESLLYPPILRLVYRIRAAIVMYNERSFTVLAYQGIRQQADGLETVILHEFSQSYMQSRFDHIAMAVALIVTCYQGYASNFLSTRELISIEN